MNSGGDYHSPNSNLAPNMQAVQQAAAVAARLAQSAGHSVHEEIKMPEKIAGLVNGRCGSDDEVKSIQAAANVKINFSMESGNYL